VVVFLGKKNSIAKLDREQSITLSR